MRSLISPSQFLSPFSFLETTHLATIELLRGLLAFTISALALNIHAMIHFDVLLGASNNIVRQSIARHAPNNLVLPRHIQLLQNLVQLLLHP